MRVYAIVVAAGTGTRSGRANPKQFELLAGKPVYLWSVDAFATHGAVEKTILVVPPNMTGPPPAFQLSSRIISTTGGASRSASVLNGLSALPLEDDDVVLIHDAARPGLTREVISELIGSLAFADAAAPALPLTDALKRQGPSGLSDLSRERLLRVQTPQAFRVGMILAALRDRSHDFVDDLAAVEAAGAKVQLTSGREWLHKITYEEDFELLERLLQPTGDQTMKVGTGFDVHAFADGDGVTLCGVVIPHSRSLAGHSDADVGWHALTDAILGALALGDIGDHFPPSDERWKGASSAVFLKHAVDLTSEHGFEVSNCDITLICETPKVKPHRQAMREHTAKVMGLDCGQVSIKATTTEGLGFTGRGEGIAAQAVVMLKLAQTH